MHWGHGQSRKFVRGAEVDDYGLSTGSGADATDQHAVRSGLWLRLQWAPRASNVEADDLTNEVFDKFDPSKRIMVSWDEVPQEVMGPLLLLGKSFMDEVAARRVVKLKLPAEPKQAKRRRVVDPWEA